MRLEFTPLEFETENSENNKKCNGYIRIYSVGV